MIEDSEMTREEILHGLENIAAGEGLYDDRKPLKRALILGEAIKAIEQEPSTWSLDDAREDFMSDVYNTLDFLPTNNEANRIIDSFDRVTSSIKQEPILDKIRAEIKQEIIPRNSDQYDHEAMWQNMGLRMALKVIDKYTAENAPKDGEEDGKA